MLAETPYECHAELVSASHREPWLVLLRGQILKRVQDDERSDSKLNELKKGSPHCCADRILHLVRTTFYACHPNIPHDRGNGFGVMVCKKALYKEKLK